MFLTSLLDFSWRNRQFLKNETGCKSEKEVIRMFYDIYLHFSFPLKNRKLRKALKLSRKSSTMEKKINCESYHPIENLLSVLRFSSFKFQSRSLWSSTQLQKTRLALHSSLTRLAAIWCTGMCLSVSLIPARNHNSYKSFLDDPL